MNSRATETKTINAKLNLEESQPSVAGAAKMSSICFVVSGDHDSAMGFRARAMAVRIVGDYNIKIAYRSQRKLLSILNIFSFLVRSRPLATYLFDISYTGVIAAGCYKLLFRNCLIIETGDAIVELVRSTGSRGKIGLWLTGLLENTAFRLADHVVVRGTFHKELLAARGMNADVIQDGVDVETFKPQDAGASRKQFGLENVLTVGLIGSSIWSEKLQICYGWELVETIRLLKDKPVKGIMIGGGSGIAHLRERCREYEIEDRIVFLGYLPYEKLPAYLGMIDICLSTQSNDLVGQVRTTGKLPLYLAAGRYILASKVGEASRVLNAKMLVEYEGVSDSGYPDKLKARIESILDCPEMLELAGSNVACAKEHFDYDVLAQRMKEVIGRTLDRRKAS